MTHSLSLTSFALASMLLGCSIWPTDQQDLVRRFYENRPAINRLKDMLDESKYQSVSDRGDTAIGYYFDGEPYDGQIAKEEQTADPDLWRSLFEQIGTYEIQVEDSGVVWMPIQGQVIPGEYESIAVFAHGEGIGELYRDCNTQVKDQDCGHCIVDLEEGWWLTYRWWPNDLTATEFDAWMAGELSESEFYENHGRKRYECFSEGGTLLGESEFL